MVSHIWIATNGKSPYIQDTIDSCNKYMPSIPVTVVNNGVAQMENYRLQLDAVDLNDDELIMLLDDDDIIINTPPSSHCIARQLTGHDKDSRMPIPHNEEVTHITVYDFIEHNNLLTTSDFSGTITTIKHLRQFFDSGKLGSTTHVSDAIFLRYLHSALNYPIDDADTIPYIYARAKQQMSSWKSETIKTLLVRQSYLLKVRCIPMYKKQLESVNKTLEALQSNEYLGPLNDD